MSALMGVVLVAGCDSTSPESGRLLRVEGQILEANQPPVFPLNVIIQAWPDLGLHGNDFYAVPTDSAGRYAVKLGPFPDGADSLHVWVSKGDCAAQTAIDLWRPDFVLSDRLDFMLPTLSVSYDLPPAQFGPGQEMCAVIETPNTPELIGDWARLALWIDEVSDSVRGRWRLNHTTSFGDDYGYFSGFQEGDHRILRLRPTQPTPCNGLEVEIPVGGDNGSTVGVSNLIGAEDCLVPSKAVRFFDLAVLPELLPP